MPANDTIPPRTRALIASDEVEGTKVYNPAHEHLGKIHHFLVDKVSGYARYAILSFGGFLGMGDRYYPIPWQLLRYDTDLKGYVVDIDRQQIDCAPSYADGSADDWVDPAYQRRIDEFYHPRAL